MPPSTRVTSLNAAAKREVAAMWRRQGNAFFSESEELLMKATTCFERERALLAEAAEDEETESLKEHWGTDVRLVKGAA
jgi:hypothetical protein